MREFSKKATAVLLMGLMTSCVFSGCALMPTEEEPTVPVVVAPKEVQYSTYEVKRGDLKRETRNTATFQPVESISMYFLADGRVSEILVKSGDDVKKGDILATQVADDLEGQYLAAKNALEKLKMQYNKVKSTSMPKKEKTYQLKSMKLDIEVAQYNFDMIEKKVNATKIVAPIDGKITYRADLATGDVIGAYVPVIIVADESEFQLVMPYSSTADSEKIKIGTKVNFTKGEINLTGTVSETPYTRPEGMEEKDNKDNIYIALDEMPKDIKTGNSGTAVLELERVENVLLVPNQAVRIYGGRTYVQILDGKKKREADVEVGLVGATETEIISGIKEGDLIILR